MKAGKRKRGGGSGGGDDRDYPISSRKYMGHAPAYPSYHPQGQNDTGGGPHYDAYSNPGFDGVPRPIGRGKPRRSFEGFIFGCNAATFDECMDLSLFGAPRKMLSQVSQITPFDTPLFLYHYTERVMYGVFEATSRGLENIVPWAWKRDTPHGGAQGSPFPAQVQFRYKYRFLPLPEAKFSHILKYGYNNKPVPQLTREKCRGLIEAFAEHDAETARRASDQLLQFFNLR